MVAQAGPCQARTRCEPGQAVPGAAHTARTEWKIILAESHVNCRSGSKKKKKTSAVAAAHSRWSSVPLPRHIAAAAAAAAATTAGDLLSLVPPEFSGIELVRSCVWFDLCVPRFVCSPRGLKHVRCSLIMLQLQAREKYWGRWHAIDLFLAWHLAEIFMDSCLNACFACARIC